MYIYACVVSSVCMYQLMSTPGPLSHGKQIISFMVVLAWTDDRLLCGLLHRLQLSRVHRSNIYEDILFTRETPLRSNMSCVSIC